MKDQRVVNSFYGIYKKCHALLENELEENKKNYLSARIIDRIIVFLFIKENLLNREETKLLDNYIENYKYISLVVMKNFIDDFECENRKLISNIINIFDTKILEEEIEIEVEIVNEIVRKLSGYKWSFSNNNRERIITPDVLGNVFEKYINQKEMGAYYTDVDTINYINNNAIVYSILKNTCFKKYIKSENIRDIISKNESLINVFENIVNNITNLIELEKIKKHLERLTVADITCGTGAFIIEAIDVILDMKDIVSDCIIKCGGKINKNRIQNLIYTIENNIYGVDIMEDAVEMAKFRIYLKVIEESIKINDTLDINIKFNIKQGNALEDGKDSQLTFNWQDEFEEVMKNGGFDCIIGNPPYIESSKIKEKYNIKNFETLKCGNMYAYIIEKAINLLGKEGTLGLIVPISIVSTKRMSSLRKIIERQCSALFCSNFADRPGTLFNGVHQKLTIIILEKGRENALQLYTSRYYHWYKSEREELFKRIKYVKNNFKNDDFYYKIGSKIEKSIIKKIMKKNISIKNMINQNIETSYRVYLSTRITFWMKSFINEKKSNEFKIYCFDNEKKALTFNAVINSSLYYFWWETVSDCWHLTNKEIELFNFNYELVNDQQKEILCNLSLELEKNLEMNKKYIGSKQTEYEYKHKKAKLIIDKIDMVLKEYYNLSDDEYEFIRDYNLSYRMNDELEEYLRNR